MTKLVLDDVPGVGSLSKINSNFDRVELALQNSVLWRNNPVGEPNSMGSSLDMNNNRIYNLPAPSTANEPARLQDLANVVSGGSVVVSSGVSAFNSRTGNVVLGNADVISAVGYTPANVVSPVFSGTPLAPTPLLSDNSYKIATTEYVTNKIASTTAGVSTVNGRSGAVTLIDTDVANSLTSNNTSKRWVWNSSVAGSVDATSQSSLYIQRNANYSGGPNGVVSAIYAQTFTPVNNLSSEWGITSEVFSKSNVQSGGWPQNVAVNGTIWKSGTAATWGGNFVAYNMMGYLAANMGGTIGVEVNCGGAGTEQNTGNLIETLGVDTVPQLQTNGVWTASSSYLIRNTVTPIGGNGYLYVANNAGTTGASQPSWPTTYGATVVDGSITWTCRYLEFRGGVAFRAAGDGLTGTSWRYGFYSLSGDIASFYSSAIGNYGMKLVGNYLYNGIDLTGINLTRSTGATANVAIALADGHAINFGTSSPIKVLFNPATGTLDFFNGSVRHGYINMASGSDSDLASGGGGGVSSFNSRTGAVSLSSSDVTGALGYTPASSVSVVDTTSVQTVGGSKSFSNSVTFGGGFTANSGVIFNSSVSLTASQTIGWNSSGNVTFSATSGGTATPATAAFFLRIVVDGVPYKVPVYNV